MKSEVKERPILFSEPMVKAILEGRKTQTRRVVKPQPDCAETSVGCIGSHPPSVLAMSGGFFFIRCPYGKPGDRLWVRETFTKTDGTTSVPDIFYRASENPTNAEQLKPWTPAILMPRWASRITLEIVSVRVERLQEISEEDAKAEGIRKLDNGTFDGGGPAMGPNAVLAFRRLWDSINGKKHPWESNPWVWVVEFRKI